MKIIFICKHNRFRSKIAKAYFKKINKNKKIHITSAGIFKGTPVSKTVVDIGKEFGLRISKQTRGIREDELVEADKIIIVADDIPKSLFNFKRFGKKISVWKIKDTHQNDRENIEDRVKKIMKNVDILNKEYKNNHI